jgi:hypothetical protein
VTLPGGFVVGANLPWLRYGGDFGANGWSRRGGLSQRDDADLIVARLAKLHEQGVEVVRWFLLCDGRAGIKYESDGTPAGLDPFIADDLQLALDWAARAGVRLLPVLLDFHWCRRPRLVSGVQIGGRHAVLGNARQRDALIDRVVAPLLSRFGQSPQILAWDLFNEPEWITFGLRRWDPRRRISRGALVDYLRLTAALVHALTAHGVTVGSASTRYLPLVQGLGLDFYSPHWYDKFERTHPVATPVSALGCDAPVLLGEFPTSGSRKTPATIIATARRAGYAGALFWSVMADDAATDFANAQAALDQWTHARGDPASA